MLGTPRPHCDKRCDAAGEQGERARFRDSRVAIGKQFPVVRQIRHLRADVRAHQAGKQRIVRAEVPTPCAARGLRQTAAPRRFDDSGGQQRARASDGSLSGLDSAPDRFCTRRADGCAISQLRYQRPSLCPAVRHKITRLSSKSLFFLSLQVCTILQRADSTKSQDGASSQDFDDITWPLAIILALYLQF